MSKRTRGGSKRRQGGLKRRKVNTREEDKVFLIACEGSRTEPNYFKKFACAPQHVEVYGKGYNTLSLVEDVIKERDRSRRRYREVWCVFDRDSFPAQDFNQALALAKRENIHVAYSNEAFELWYLLHFDYLVNGMNRSLYEKMLSNRLGFPYKKMIRQYLRNLLHIKTLQLGMRRNYWLLTVLPTTLKKIILQQRFIYS